MGLGNLSRRVGMNQDSRSDRKKLVDETADHPNQALNDAEAVEASKRPEKRERKNVTNLTEDIRALVADFSDVEAQLAVLNARRAELKQRATQLSLEHGIDDFTGPEGKVQVIVKSAPNNFDKKKVKQYLTEAQYKACFKVGKVPDPTVKFVPADKL